MKSYQYKGKHYELTPALIAKVNRKLVGFQKIEQVTTPSPKHIRSLISVLSQVYRDELPIKNIHEMAAAYLDISRHEMYQLMLKPLTERAQDKKLRKTPPSIDVVALQREWQDAMARTGSAIPIDQFRKTYIKNATDHLIDRPAAMPRHILGETVNGVMRYYRSTPEELTKAITSCARKSILISLMDSDAIDVGCSRFGGKPDLPVGATLPHDVDGVPMEFICQINLNEATTTRGWYVEEHGLLSIFKMQEAYQEFAGHDTLQIIYTPPDQELVRREDYTGTLFQPSRTCTFSIGKTLPLPNSSAKGRQLMERHNRDALPLYEAAREKYHNRQASYLGYGYHDEPTYHQSNGKRVVNKHFMDGYIPLLYLPVTIDGVQIYSGDPSGAFAIFIKTNKHQHRDYSELSYMYHVC